MSSSLLWHDIDSNVLKNNANSFRGEMFLGLCWWRRRKKLPDGRKRRKIGASLDNSFKKMITCTDLGISLSLPDLPERWKDQTKVSLDLQWIEWRLVSKCPVLVFVDSLVKMPNFLKINMNNKYYCKTRSSKKLGTSTRFRSTQWLNVILQQSGLPENPLIILKLLNFRLKERITSGKH